MKGLTNIKDFSRLENESDEELIYRICSQKDLIGTWEDVAKVLNEELGNNFTSSKYRKEYQYFENMLRANQAKFTGSAQLDELKEATEKLEKEKVKIRRERSELKKLYREQADRESYMEQIQNSILDHTPKSIFYDENKKFTGVLQSNCDALISLFDVHAGIDINNYFNTYNTDVLQERMNQYLDKIFEVYLRHGTQDAYVVVSELISGFIKQTKEYL